MEKGAEQDFATELARLRRDIDRVDAELLTLLNERAGLSLAVGRLKKKHGRDVFAPEREKQLLETLLARNSGPLSPAQLAGLYRALFAVSRELQD